MRVTTIEATERQTTRGEVTTIKEFTVEQTKYAYCREHTTQIQMSGLNVYVDNNGPLDWALKVKGCVQIVVLVSLRKHIIWAEYNSSIAGNTGEQRK